MNRIIKFRTWNGERWIYLEGIYNMPQPEYVGEDYQFTGLTDKNGVEIYEGDIVKSVATPDLSVPYITAQVIWEAKLYSDGNPGFVLKFLNSAGTSKFNTFRRKPLEVIGNIWENPELLAP